MPNVENNRVKAVRPVAGAAFYSAHSAVVGWRDLLNGRPASVMPPGGSADILYPTDMACLIPSILSFRGLV